MSGMVERDYERTVRIQAPMRGLYREMDTAANLARFVPEIEHTAPGSGDDHVRIFGTVSIGPLFYRLDGDLAVRRVDPPRLLAVIMRANGPSLELEGTFEFSVSSAEETTVRYSAILRSGHPLVRRMRNAVLGLLEEHVDATTDLLVARARQYAAAERLLSQSDGPGDEG